MGCIHRVWEDEVSIAISSLLLKLGLDLLNAEHFLLSLSIFTESNRSGDCLESHRTTRYCTGLKPVGLVADVRHRSQMLHC